MEIDDREEPPKKRVKMNTVRATFHLGRNIRAQAMLYEGQSCIDIRQWNHSEVDEWVPKQKKGIWLSLQRWEALLSYADHVKGFIEDVIQHHQVDVRHRLSGTVHLTMKSPNWLVNIREWFMDNGRLQPGWKGIALKFPEWRKLLAISGEVSRVMPEIKGFVPCYLEGDHQNQLGAMMCAECNPYEYQDFDY